MTVITKIKKIIQTKAVKNVMKLLQWVEKSLGGLITARRGSELRFMEHSTMNK